MHELLCGDRLGPQVTLHQPCTSAHAGPYAQGPSLCLHHSLPRSPAQLTGSSVPALRALSKLPTDTGRGACSGLQLPLPKSPSHLQESPSCLASSHPDCVCLQDQAASYPSPRLQRGYYTVKDKRFRSQLANTRCIWQGVLTAETS